MTKLLPWLAMMPLTFIAMFVSALIAWKLFVPMGFLLFFLDEIALTIILFNWGIDEVLK